MDEFAFHRSWLLRKFDEIFRRWTAACDQLDDEAIGWVPGPGSNSIAHLTVHVAGNIHERIGTGMLGRTSARDREAEFGPAALAYSRGKLDELLRESFALLGTVLKEAGPELLQRTQTVRGRERTNLDMFHQCAAHFSEHLGQVLYIAKLKLGDSYVSTSLPGTGRTAKLKKE